MGAILERAVGLPPGHTFGAGPCTAPDLAAKEAKLEDGTSALLTIGPGIATSFDFESGSVFLTQTSRRQRNERQIF